MHSTCIVIPVFNNPKTIQKVLEDTLYLNLFIVVVDDGSDEPIDQLLNRNANITVLRHTTNQGKGKAIITGTKEAKKRGFKYIITVDADGQHYPSEVEKMIPLLKPDTIVIGDRKFKEDVPFSSKFGRSFSNFWIFIESGRWLRDTQSGFRAYPVSILNLHLSQTRYDFEIEVIIKHIWAKGKVESIPIEVYYPPKGTRVSHFDKVEDNIRLSKLHSKLVFKNILRIFKLGAYFSNSKK